MELLQAIKKGQPLKDLAFYNNARKYKVIGDNISITEVNGKEIAMLDGRRIVVPLAARKHVMKELHRAHSGLTKTYKTASQLYYWPSMKNDIKQTIDACTACQESRPTQPRIRLTPKGPVTSTPMQEVGADLLEALGQNWLVLVDRYSGYAWTCLLYTSPSPRDLSTSRMPSSA